MASFIVEALPVFFVKLFLDVSGNVFFNGELFKGSRGEIDHILLHIALHVAIFDHGNL